MAPPSSARTGSVTTPRCRSGKSSFSSTRSKRGAWRRIGSLSYFHRGDRNSKMGRAFWLLACVGVAGCAVAKSEVPQAPAPDAPSASPHSNDETGTFQLSKLEYPICSETYRLERSGSDLELRSLFNFVDRAPAFRSRSRPRWATPAQRDFAWSATYPGVWTRSSASTLDTTASAISRKLRSR
jgi:hypothetical protein